MNLLQLKCPNCDVKHSVGPAIRTFECACGKRLRVPTQQAQRTANKPAAERAATQKVAAKRPAKPAPQQPAAASAREAGANPAAVKPTVRKRNGKPRTVQARTVQARTVASTTVTEETPVAPEEPKLAPFVLKPQTEMNSDGWNFDDAPTLGFFRILWENLKFFTRAIVPYAVVIALVVAGFLYKEEITTRASSLHERLVTRMRPAPVDLEVPDASSIVDGVPLPDADAPATDVATDLEPPSESIPAAAASRAIQAHVVISIPGQGQGAGVVCGIVGRHALVLTNKSLVDSMFWLNGGKKVTDNLPTVNVMYSNELKSTGEVVWLADGDVDLAIVKAECTVGTIEPVNWRSGAGRVERDDRVFFVGAEGSDGGLIETRVKELVEEPIVTVPVVRVDVSQHRVPRGAALYNKDGDLVAITGASDMGDMAGVAVHVSVLEKLQPAALLER